MDLALSLASEGDRLIENSHYAEDSIRPKCSELRGVYEEIRSTLRSKKNLLLRALELHHALEKVGFLFRCVFVFVVSSVAFISISPPLRRRCNGVTMASSCWRASQWTAVSLRMEPKLLCRN